MIFIQTYKVYNYLADIKPPSILRRLRQTIMTGNLNKLKADSINVPRWKMDHADESRRLQMLFPSFWRGAFGVVFGFVFNLCVDVFNFLMDVSRLDCQWRWAAKRQRRNESHIR
jgi:hypothetical protein